MAEERLTVQMEGTEIEGGFIRFNEFLDELFAVKSSLRRTERLLHIDAESPVTYRIVDLSHSSPAMVTIGVVSNTHVYASVPRKIVRRFTTSLRMIGRNHRFAEDIDTQTLQTYRKMTDPIGQHIGAVTFKVANEVSVRVDREFRYSVDRLIGGDEKERDELVGRLERIDIHNKNQFDIYPVIGPAKIRCTFPKRLQEKVLSCIGHTVSVDGWALYKKDSHFPFAMRVVDINPLAFDDELPRLSDLHGIAPDATNGLSPEGFIRQLRDANW